LEKIIANAFASTLPKPHEPTLQPKLCQRACKASPREEFQNFSSTLKRKKLNNANTLATQTEKKNEVVI
jgi:hypothetical protein